DAELRVHAVPAYPRRSAWRCDEARGARARPRRPRDDRRGTARRPGALGHRGAGRARVRARRQSVRRRRPRGHCSTLGGPMKLHDIVRGDAPLVIDIPHAGTHVPPALAATLTAAARTLPDTDWHVDRLYAFARASGPTLFVATHSRYVVDLNRDPSGASLYPGADVTELCPTRTFANEPIWAEGTEPAPALAPARRAQFSDPYHTALAAEIEPAHRSRANVILLDGHSIPSRVP